MARYVLRANGWGNGNNAMYVAAKTVAKGAVTYTNATGLARKFSTHKAANAYRRKNERGWGWSVVEC